MRTDPREFEGTRVIGNGLRKVVEIGIAVTAPQVCRSHARVQLDGAIESVQRGGEFPGVMQADPFAKVILWGNRRWNTIGTNTRVILAKFFT